mgnify:CR=1 FL=1
MKFQAMLKILFTLLKKKKTSAAELASACCVSERSIHRYLEELIVSGVPIDIIRGRNGGIFLPDTYKLPENFFTKEEYSAAINALGALYEQLHDDAVADALNKLLSQQKSDSRNLTLSGRIVVDSGTWGDAYDFSEKLKVMEEAAENDECLDLLYIDRNGNESRRVIEPHLLVYKQNIWYVYAWCRKRSDFRLFKVGRIRSARKTGEIFARREIDRDNLPLKFDFKNTELTDIVFYVEKHALPDVEEWIGMDNVQTHGDRIVAEATLPAGEPLYSKILSFGDGIRIVSPESVAEEVRMRAEKILALYRR